MTLQIFTQYMQNTDLLFIQIDNETSYFHYYYHYYDYTTDIHTHSTCITYTNNR